MLKSFLVLCSETDKQMPEALAISIAKSVRIHKNIEIVYYLCPYQEESEMELVYTIIVSSILVLFFLVLWLRERRRAEIEYVAYGLRADEDSDENTKTNLTEMEAGFVEAISKLEELGEVQQDDWGRWVWVKTGEQVGSAKNL